MVRSMMSFSTLPISFWGYALETAACILNLVLSKSLPKTLLELWNGHKPNLRHIRIWGCPSHVLKGKTEKLESRSEICMLIGYPKDQENVQGDEEVMVSSEGDTNIDENVTIPNEAMVQDPSPLRKGQRVIRKLSRYLFVGESK
ncbi:Uncharacterized protein Adt_31703 [Abeliophyllum distichum]|uniref:Uncharacterized protein n=1 Tax=Abeliophyllum distichum TaxID=126358 RepID=A0ABD1REU8_9LAMI